MPRKAGPGPVGWPGADAGPSEIAPGVFVGGWSDAATFEGARICVRDAGEADDPRVEVHVPIYDPASDAPLRANLEEVVGLVDEARRAGRPVLLFCGHGIRRGPLAGAWYLHRHDAIPLDEAYARLRAVRPDIDDVSEWVGQWEVLTEPGAPAPSPVRALPRRRH